MCDLVRIQKCLKELKGDYFEVTQGLITGGWMSSFALLKLIKMLEEEAEIKIPIEEITVENFDSVTAIQLLIDKHK